MAEEPHRLIVVDPQQNPYTQQPAVRLELEADVEAVCRETGLIVTLKRGRYVVVEESVLQSEEPVNGVWS